ncbi:hypothetical protein BG015_008151 [Linnemannia schmuckeri]|uniref:Uncharacterized protein n=1 Tax=Linnemannia schmuckeri TaxID=64567 RepID=A0A9P5RXD3_9FUNG|nr:hypothetical protein BG015_008151 [Linnemannia schmuckeri]
MASASPLEPYNVWEDVASTKSITLSNIDADDNDSTITTATTTSNHSSNNGGSPPRYSVQTIRQKKGRQLVSTMMGADDDDSKDSNGVVGVLGGGLFPTAIMEETTEGENGGESKKKTTTTTTRTTTTSSSSGRPSTPAAGGTDIQSSAAGSAAGGQVVLTKAPLGGSGGTGGRGGFPSVGLYQGIGRVQAFSAMAFSTFAVIHLVPPMLASVGGVELANKALIWGRVYYQTYGLEQVLVSGSLLIHLGAGLCKAVIRMVWKVKSYYSGSSSTTPSAIEEGDAGDTSTTKKSLTMTTASGSTTSTTTTTKTTITESSVTGGGSRGSASAPGLFPYHRLVGWILAPMVVSHMNVMRLAPLEVLGDSSMVDYSFVTYLHRIGRSGPYVLLVGLLAYHMFGGTSQEGARHQKLEKAREKMMQDFEQQRIQIAKDHEVKAAADKFVVQHSNVEEALKQSTIGLVHLKDFQKVRLELEELKKREAAQTNKLQERVVKKKAKKVISKLSFADDEEEESSAASSPKDIKGKKRAQDNDDSNNSDGKPPTPPTEPVMKKSKFGKDPNIDTSFLPDREREEEERRVREELRQEWLAKQQKIKNETIQITYSYWDGSGHRKEVECKKGDTIAQFLEKCRQQFQQLRGVSIDNMMYVKEDLIIPHHYTFYDFIINKARGKSGPLFSFDVHEDIRLTNDAGVEKDESHAGKVVERSYYERNKHIFPLSRFEIYDPEKSYGKYSIKGNAK